VPLGDFFLSVYQSEGWLVGAVGIENTTGRNFKDLEEMLGNAETLRNNKEREDILIGLGNSETNGKSGACKALSGALSKV